MNRTTRNTRRRLTPRTTVIGGAALGLIAGATVYGAVASAATPMTPAAFKAPVAKTARLANCSANTKLENGVCVVHVLKTVTVPATPASAAAKAKAAHQGGATPANLLNLAGEKSGEKSGKSGDNDADGKRGESDSRERAAHRDHDGDDATVAPVAKTPAPAATTVKAPVPAPVVAPAGVPAPPAGAPVPSAAS
jgi:hypothetical protein